MSTHLDEITVQAEIFGPITIPEARYIEKDEIFTLPRWAAERLEEMGVVKMYGGPSEDKAVRPLRANKEARALAAELEIDLALIEGTGKGGYVTKTDVKKYAKGLGLL
jgi:hypothetical protein